MLKDLVKRSILTFQDIEHKALQQIDGFLPTMRKSICSYNLLPPDLPYKNVKDQTRELRAKKSIIVTPHDLITIDMFNEKQKQAFKVITERIYLGKTGAFFIDSLTFLYRTLLADVRSKGFLALATTTSGIAASILPGGRTMHS